ncbi:MAG: hypothetical protein IPN77_19145 [Sandaracinaceae bacterium]|nr:hypothetical protein [Sandaracinaceae bacterium]
MCVSAGGGATPSIKMSTGKSMPGATQRPCALSICRRMVKAIWWPSSVFTAASGQTIIRQMRPSNAKAISTTKLTTKEAMEAASE